MPTKYRLSNFLLDLCCMIVTGGLWMIWIIIRQLRAENEEYRIWNLLLDIVCIICTAGLWFVWIAIRQILANK